VEHVLELLQEWQQKQQRMVPVEQLAEAAGLRRHLDAYKSLNEQLRGLRVSAAWLLPRRRIRLPCILHVLFRVGDAFVVTW
jgi:hypothetical protein